ncbi:MAG: dihydroorotase [Erysipelotrichales bacterium]|nr:dihydroorotase [Erysipelotrichales bacterium]
MLILKNGSIRQNGQFIKCDIALQNDEICEIAASINAPTDALVFDISNCVVLPGFEDAHVHLREPGFSYKETIKSGCMSAARGGYTLLCTMPNLKPVPDSYEHLKEQLDIIERDACIGVLPLGSVTVNEAGEELSDMEALAPYIIGYSDDGKGVQDSNLLKEAMIKAAKLNKPMMLHLEDMKLVNGGYVADTEYLLSKGYKGICAASEYEPVKEAIRLAKETGCHLHVCHISCKESAEAIRQAKKDGIHVTCEVTPHHLISTDKDVTDDANWKMNPPLRSEEDRQALIAALNDGTIDVIATDNAPHSVEEKQKGLASSPFGIITNEYAFGLLYTNLVQTGLVSLDTLIEKMTTAMHILRNEDKAEVKVGAKANLCVYNLDKKFVIETLHSISQNCPYVGYEVCGENEMTIYEGNVIYQKGDE